MKRLLKAILLPAALLLTSAGCGDKGGSTQDDEPAEKEKSAIQQATEDLTGASAARKGREMEEQIDEIYKDRQRRLEEAYGE